MPKRTLPDWQNRYYPIIYVRGYAGTQGEVEDTVADPYMGFNIGATKIRQNNDGDAVRHYFESPLVRLMKDYEYSDIYEGGQEIPPAEKISPRSVFIHRYYDSASAASELGRDNRKEIEQYAAELGDLILKVRKRYEKYSNQHGDFKIYLVAHSMGGLIVRCFLQNEDLTTAATDKTAMAKARKMVDKVFTYATPHNGIDLRILGNMPRIFSHNNADNFNRARMAEYLQSSDKSAVNSLDDKFDPDRFFCLVGTNSENYEAASGAARTIVGPSSDGLVRIANATVWGPKKIDGKTVKRHSPRSFVHRSHSGHYGIVNSESGYQNMVRFFFGTVRVDGILDIHELPLPPKIQKAKDNDKTIKAAYHFESVLQVRGKYWDMHRREVEKHSAVFRDYDKMVKDNRSPYLFSAFLTDTAKVNPARRSLGFSLDLRVLVPQYEIDGFLFFDDHYEQGYIYREKINLDATPPTDDKDSWRLSYGIDSRTPNRAGKSVEPKKLDDGLEFAISIEKKTKPGIIATLRLIARPWS